MADVHTGYTYKQNPDSGSCGNLDCVLYIHAQEQMAILTEHTDK